MLKHKRIKYYSGGGWLQTPESLSSYSKTLGLLLGWGDIIKGVSTTVGGMMGSSDSSINWDSIGLLASGLFGNRGSRLINKLTKNAPIEGEYDIEGNYVDPVLIQALGGYLNRYDAGGWVDGIGNAVGDTMKNYAESAKINNAVVDAGKLGILAKLKQLVTSNSLDNLLAELMSNRLLNTDFSRKQVQGAGTAGRLVKGLFNALNTGFNTMMKTGNLWAGIGAAAASGIANITGTISAKKRAGRLANRLNNYGATVNNVINNRFASRALMLDTLNDAMNMMNYSAYGGPLEIALAQDYNNALIQSRLARAFQASEPYILPLMFACGGKKHAYGGDLSTHGNIFDNGIMYINEGGTHEQNPYLGVQIGVDLEGTPNLVEENELVWNDYVFSQRLKTPLKFLDKYKIKAEGLSFAETAERLAKESEERPNDPVSKETLNVLMQELADTLEELKAKRLELKRKRIWNSLAPEQLQMLAMQALDNVLIQDLMELLALAEQLAQLEGMMLPLMSAFGGQLNRFDVGGYKYDPINQFKYWSNGNYDDGYRKFIENLTDGLIQDLLTNWWGENGENFNRFTGAGGTRDLITAERMKGSRGALDGKYSDLHKFAAALYEALARKDLAAAQPEEKSNPYVPVTRYWKTGLTDANTGLALPDEEILDYNPNSPLTGWSHLRTDTADNGDTNVYFTATPKEKTDILDPSLPKSNWLSNLRFAPTLGSLGQVFSDAIGLTNSPNYTEADAALLSIANLRAMRAPLTGRKLTYNPQDSIWALRLLESTLNLNMDATIGKANGNRALAMALASYLSGINQGQVGNLLLGLDDKNWNNMKDVTTFNNDVDLKNAQMAMEADRANMSLNSIISDAILKSGKARLNAYEAADTARAKNLENFLNNLGALGLNQWNMNSMNNTGTNFAFGNNGMYYRPNANGGSIIRKKNKKRR